MSPLDLSERPFIESEANRPLFEDGQERALQVFLAHRVSLFRIAFRILRDSSRAEDCVQEAWLRWQLTDRDVILNPAAFLTTTVTHLAINQIQSATHRREAATASLSYVSDDRAPDPARRLDQGAAVAEVLRMLLARLSGSQLTAYILRRGFDYPYADIARLLRTSVPNARQLVRRAQARVATGPDRRVGAGVHRLLVEAFLAAARVGDLSRLERLLIQTARSDLRQPRPPSETATLKRA